MATLVRPIKEGNATTYQGKVALGYQDILASEVDADLDTIYAAWNGRADLLWSTSATALSPTDTTKQVAVPGPTTGSDLAAIIIGTRTQKGRLFSFPAIEYVGLSINGYYNGTSWAHDDSTKSLWRLSMRTDTDNFIISRETPSPYVGTNLLTLDNTGTLTLVNNALLGGSTLVLGNGTTALRGSMGTWTPGGGTPALDIAVNPGQVVTAAPIWLMRLNANGDNIVMMRQAPNNGAWITPFTLDSLQNLSIGGNIYNVQSCVAGIRCSQGGGTLTGGYSNQIGIGWNGTAFTIAVDNVYKGTINVTASDERLKTDVAEDVPGLDAVLALRPVTFRFKEGYNPPLPDGTLVDEPRHYGLIAQEAQPHVPLVVTEGEDGFFELDYRLLVPVLIRAVQELAARMPAA